MAEKCIKKYFNLSLGCYCGVLLNKPLAQKVLKMLYRHNQELKQLLADNLDNVEVADWTCVLPRGEQTTITYYAVSTEEEKIERIKLIDKAHQLNRKVGDVWRTDKKHSEAKEDVKKSFLEEFVLLNGEDDFNEEE